MSQSTQRVGSPGAWCHSPGASRSRRGNPQGFPPPSCSFQINFLVRTRRCLRASPQERQAVLEPGSFLGLFEERREGSLWSSASLAGAGRGLREGR